MISVCMAVKNGAVFLNEQIASILPQLGEKDELVISDDGSTDATCDIIRSFSDSRIRLLLNPGTGLIANFDHCLSSSYGDLIFLSDQDDRWMENKIEIMKVYLKQYDLVISDCIITDPQLATKEDSYFKLNRSGKGLIKNLMRNSYMGCCMAFRRTVLEKALPFPKNLPVHDLWIGLIGELYFKIAFIDDKLVYHRRHAQNTSSTSTKSNFTLRDKIQYRFRVLKNLVSVYYAK